MRKQLTPLHVQVRKGFPFPGHDDGLDYICAYVTTRDQ